MEWGPAGVAVNLLRETSLSRKPPTGFQTKPVASKSEPGRESRVWSILPGRFWGPALLGVIKITAPCYRVLAVCWALSSAASALKPHSSPAKRGWRDAKKETRSEDTECPAWTTQLSPDLEFSV